MKSKMIRVTISLPVALLEAMDSRLAGEDDSRSSMMRRLIESALKQVQERDDVERWVRSYQEHPQSEDYLPWPEEPGSHASQEIPWNEVELIHAGRTYRLVPIETSLSPEERARRHDLVQRTLAARNRQKPLGITTAQLIHEVRTGRYGE